MIKKICIITGTTLISALVIWLIINCIIVSNREYLLSDDNKTLVEYYGTSNSFEIPNGVEVIEDYVFKNCTSLENIVIPDSVKIIGEGAFYKCKGLKNIEIPNSVTNIGHGAFAYCTNLENIEIPKKIIYIGNSVFLDCNNLKYNTYDKAEYLGNKDNPYLVLMNTIDDDLEECRINENTRIIYESAFSGCKNLRNIKIPNSVTSIGSGAFSNCTNLKYNIYKECSYLGNYDNPYLVLMNPIDDDLEEYEINKNTRIIYERAFSGCKYLESIEIPKRIISIGDDAFSDCINLENIEIPKGVNNIGYRAFSECINLESIKVNEDNEYFQSIDGNLYSKDGTILIQYAIGKTDDSFIIPKTVRNIYDYAFAYCTFIENIEIPKNIKSIGSGAFSNCTNLEYNIYDNVKYLGNENNPYLVLMNTIDDDLEECEINKKTKIIREGAFSFCTSLESITIPNSVTSIGDRAFSCCENLGSIVVDKKNQYYKSIDGNLYSKDGKTLIQYAIGKKDTSFVIPNTVTSIGDYAFYLCTSLEIIKIPNSVTSIGDYAFYFCTSLESIKIPNSVTSIGEYAFSHCTSLESIKIPNSVTSIGDRAFSHCTSLESIKIPNSVTSIGQYAFSHCTSLESIIIPKGVNNIGYKVFSDCPNLTIYCEIESKPDVWDKIWNPDNRPVIWGYKK